ncbi:tRNA lysidine(34) synthetase TilS [Leptospira ilyithenensis]|uniref:tRNA lysidine(34) synthetase TilS n=1 Tax=Leptospira ilyithenensis TaxID=2484901 RepID=UPI0024825441|nr:tRNA lysidine(34) synthetase TilS [Leptospira ilyithenensis]
MEETGRIARYEELNQLSDSHNTYYATGHHPRDYFESILLHLTRGGGKNALQTLPPLSPNRFLPLAFLEDKERVDCYSRIVESYPVYEDESNADSKFKRNRIRNEILPLLEKENLNYYSIYWNFHSWEKTEFETFLSFYIERNSEPLPKKNSVKAKHFLIPHQTWIHSSKEKKKTLLDFHLELLGFPSVYKAPFEDFIRQTAGERAFLQNKLFTIYKSKLGDTWIMDNSSPLFSIPISQADGNNLYIRWNDQERRIPNINGKLSFQISRPGEKIQVSIGKKEISECLREKKIPFFIRENIPILYYEGKPIQILFSFFDSNLKDLPQNWQNKFL